MRILILGAGAVGGYLGARLVESGADVTFLLRQSRQASVKKNGLSVVSALGDVNVLVSSTTLDELNTDFDLLIIACKSFSLNKVLTDLGPVLGHQTTVLPFMNGVRHLQSLDLQFGKRRVIGGVAHLSVNLEDDGTIRHLNDFHRYWYGPRHAAQEHICELLGSVFSESSLDDGYSVHIEQDMWDKFVFLSTLAGATCLFRASVGDVLETASGESFITGLLQECIDIAAVSGFAPNKQSILEYQQTLTEKGSNYSASMLRDIQSGARTEASHILGDMLRRGINHNTKTDLLGYAYSHLQAYEKNRS